jgi:hypothetical protein
LLVVCADTCACGTYAIVMSCCMTLVGGIGTMTSFCVRLFGTMCLGSNRASTRRTITARASGSFILVIAFLLNAANTTIAFQRFVFGSTHETLQSAGGLGGRELGWRDGLRQRQRPQRRGGRGRCPGRCEVVSPAPRFGGRGVLNHGRGR